MIKDYTNNIVFRLAKHIADRSFIYYLLNFTWGLLTTTVGYILLLLLLPFGKIKKFRHTIYIELKWDLSGAWSIGTVIFVPKNPNNSLLEHEYGHSVQNAVLGPLMLILVMIPSLIRFWYREIVWWKIKKQAPPTVYDDIWFEATATYLGNRRYTSGY